VLQRSGSLLIPHEERAAVLGQIARSAGKRIASEVNLRHAPVPNEPNQVMSATLIAAFITDGEATLANLGDSRAYLVRGGIIERVTIDHDRSTDALRMGLTFREAANVRMGSALTRVVGRVIVDADGRVHPDPFDPELFRLRLLPGDRLILCSDGVSDFAAGAGAEQTEAEDVILEAALAHEDPARLAYEVVVLANRGGGYDNISCVVIAAHPG
jgi:protein phosphatase